LIGISNIEHLLVAEGVVWAVSGLSRRALILQWSLELLVYAGMLFL